MKHSGFWLTWPDWLGSNWLGSERLVPTWFWLTWFLVLTDLVLTDLILSSDWGGPRQTLVLCLHCVTIVCLLCLHGVGQRMKSWRCDWSSWLSLWGILSSSWEGTEHSWSPRLCTTTSSPLASRTQARSSKQLAEFTAGLSKIRSRDPCSFHQNHSVVWVVLTEAQYACSGNTVGFFWGGEAAPPPVEPLGGSLHSNWLLLATAHERWFMAPVSSWATTIISNCNYILTYVLHTERSTVCSILKRLKIPLSPK